ncbi:MAG: GDSL-type esterase/lipase family protein [Acutalibacteraceae bacterium]|nr:GDSL-type esterase/lipase family protein [Acutalibacteraceae bacterium]
MKIIEKIVNKGKDRWKYPTPTIAFLGDSVTQGCFEVYNKNDGNIETVFDKTSAYHKYFDDMLTVLFPGSPVNIINAGISGDRAPLGYDRLERDVLSHNPDLTVVCYGLNDNSWGLENINLYTEALDKIFTELIKNGSEVIFLTPNMQNTEVSCHLKEENMRSLALLIAQRQNEGVLDAYIEAGREVARKHGVKICDVYAKWKRLEANGVNTTELLANYLNHPTRDMNRLFAYSLIETIFED